MALPRSAWEQARERFLEGLEEPERLLFAEASLENIFYSASAAQKIHEENSRSRYLASKLNSLLAGVEQFGKALDVLSQASLVSSILWGSLRVVIHMSSQFEKYFTVLIDMFEQIGDVVPRFQAYERLFSSNPRLMQLLSNAYLDIFKFCTSAKAAFGKARKSIINVKLFFVSWKSVEQQFVTLMKDFKRHRKSVEKETELAHLIEAEKSRAIDRANLKQQEKHNSEVERLRLLQLLSSVHWERQQSRILDMRHPGTGTWIRAQEIFTQWKMVTETRNQQCLWCYGIPGSGKTVLTASVIDALSQEVDFRDRALAFFYCDYADYETFDLSTILGTIIQQLLVFKPNIEERIAAKIRAAYDNGIRKSSPGDLFQLLELIVHEYQHCVYIVLDGVDEVLPDTQKTLLSGFAKLSASCGTLLKLYVSAREITLISDYFPSYLSFDISESRAAEDIENYIKASVQQRLHSLPVILNHPYLEESAVRELAAKAQGMFLWVSLQMEELCDPSHSERSFKFALQDLPEGLTATYERIYRKISGHSSRQRTLAQKIFDWTVCAKRPLTFHELKDAVAIDLNDVLWDRQKISAETDGKRFLHVCGNLVVFHESDTTVRLAHHTVGQFLEQERRDLGRPDVKIGELCLTYLGFSDFETQLVLARKQQEILNARSSKQASVSQIPQILGLYNGIYAILMALYSRNKHRSLPDVNYAELIRRYQRKPLPPSLAQKYYLLDYVTANWLWHAKAFDPQTSKCWSSFRDLVFHKALPFDFRPWKPGEGPPKLPHMRIYLWALENDHLPLMHLLKNLPGRHPLRPYLRYKTLCQDRVPSQVRIVEFEDYPDAFDWPARSIFLEGREKILELCLEEDPSLVSHRHIMMRALRDANFGVIGRLLGAGAELSKSEIDATNALHIASRRGIRKLVEILLLDFGADANSRLFQDECGRTPLYEAVMNDASDGHGHRGTCIDYACSCSSLDTVQLLLERGADPNAKQIGGETVLHKALSLGEAYVRLLLSSGADVDARNEGEQSILDLAANISDRMIDVLVEYGVRLDARDRRGRTTLLKAARDNTGDGARVKKLIRHGANIHVKDKEGYTVLHHLGSSSDGALRQLLELGMDVNARDKHGQTALGLAVEASDNAKFKLLLEFGADLGAEGQSPLIEAAARGNLELLTMLLRMGNDPNVLGDSELSAISSAVDARNKEVVIALLGAGTDPNLRDETSMSPLGRAVQNRDKDIGGLLIQAGAAIQPPGRKPYSPVYIAISSNDVDMLKFLIQQGAEVSTFRPADCFLLQAKHLAMRTYLTELGVPFSLQTDLYPD